jgi:hypothetical protein
VCLAPATCPFMICRSSPFIHVAAYWSKHSIPTLKALEQTCGLHKSFAKRVIVVSRLLGCDVVCRVALVGLDVSEELIASIIGVAGIRKLVTDSYCFVNSLRIISTLVMEAIIPYETLVLSRGTRYHTTEEGIVHSNLNGNLKCLVIVGNA